MQDPIASVKFVDAIDLRKKGNFVQVTCLFNIKQWHMVVVRNLYYSFGSISITNKLLLLDV